MNQIERLQDDLTRRFPELAIEIDEPGTDAGSWFLDIRRGAGITPVVIEWRRDRGFGVSTPDTDDFGTGPDEVFPNAKAALNRVVELVLSGGHSLPPEAVRLAALRQSRGLSQGELAERVGMGQANLSRIETRDDILVSTLTKVVAAMGATLSIRARFPDGVEREISI